MTDRLVSGNRVLKKLVFKASLSRFFFIFWHIWGDFALSGTCRKLGETLKNHQICQNFGKRMEKGLKPICFAKSEKVPENPIYSTRSEL